MNNKVLIAIAVVVLLGIGGFVVMSKKPMTAPEGDSRGKQGETVNTPASKGEQSLKDLFASGTSQKCTFSTSASKESSGVVYVSGGRVRGDFTVQVSGQNMTTHMIGDGTTSYIWTDGQKTGFKMAFDPTTETQDSAATSTQSQSVDLNTKMNYDCSSWSADQSMFVVPATVTFTEMNVPKTNTSVKDGENNDMKIQQCAACDNVPASAQAQCKAALGCN